MLQNQCKGMIFYPNNQKKRHKKHKSARFFDLRRHYKIQYIPYALSYKSKKNRVIAQNINHLKVHTFVYEAFCVLLIFVKFIRRLFSYILRRKARLIIVIHNKVPKKMNLVPKKPQQVPKKMMICLKSFK